MNYSTKPPEIITTLRSAEVYKNKLFREFPDIHSLLAEFEGKNILDLGAGSNPYYNETLQTVIKEHNHTARKEKKIHFTSLDIKYGRLEYGYGRQKNQKMIGADVRIGQIEDLNHLPFQDATFDYIISSFLVGTRHYIDDEKVLLTLAEDCKRILKDWGQIRLFPINSQNYTMLKNESFIINNFIDKTPPQKIPMANEFNDPLPENNIMGAYTVILIKKHSPQ